MKRQKSLLVIAVLFSFLMVGAGCKKEVGTQLKSSQEDDAVNKVPGTKYLLKYLSNVLDGDTTVLQWTHPTTYTPSPVAQRAAYVTPDMLSSGRDSFNARFTRLNVVNRVLWNGSVNRVWYSRAVAMSTPAGYVTRMSGEWNAVATDPGSGYNREYEIKYDGTFPSLNYKVLVYWNVNPLNQIDHVFVHIETWGVGVGTFNESILHDDKGNTVTPYIKAYQQPDGSWNIQWDAEGTFEGAMPSSNGWLTGKIDLGFEGILNLSQADASTIIPANSRNAWGPREKMADIKSLMK